MYENESVVSKLSGREQPAASEDDKDERQFIPYGDDAAQEVPGHR